MWRVGRVLLVLWAAGVVLGLAWCVFAAGTVAERSSLKGVKPIRVAVGKIRPDAASDGLSAARLRAIMDARLRAAGVPAHQNATNDLLLIVSTSPQKNGMWGKRHQEFFVRSTLRAYRQKTPGVFFPELRQLVALFHEYVRDPESRGMAATWRTSWIGLLKTDELKKVEPELTKLVDRFTADWRIGNLGRRR